MFIQNEYSIKGKKWQVSVLLSLITYLFHNEFFFRKKWTVMIQWNEISETFNLYFSPSIWVISGFLNAAISFCFCIFTGAFLLGTEELHGLSFWGISTWVSETSPFSAGASENGNSFDIQSCPLTEMNALAEIFVWKKW